MQPHTCSWTLDLMVRCRLSILEARLMTQNKINIIAGRNGSGKSQLLAIIHSFVNTKSDGFLQNIGYRNYFPKEQSKVEISGPTRIYYLAPTRVLGKDSTERKGGPYSFADLEDFHFGERYGKFRKTLSRLAMEAECYSKKGSPEANAAIRLQKEQLLKFVQSAFAKLVPDLRLEFVVDAGKREVSGFAYRRGMPFVRPQDARFGDELRIPFGTISDGELNALFLVFELLYHAAEASTPALVMIDEIENHLHPALLGKFLSLLPTILPDHMMLLATTHSPLVITSVQPASRILMMHSSDAYLAKNSNQLITSNTDAGAASILYNLYGAESHQAAQILAEDIQNAAAGELLTYAQQSLLESYVIARSNPSDPQRTFLTGLIHARQADHRELKVLDFGAGHGRLIQGLREDIPMFSGSQLLFDVVESNEDCKASLESLARVSRTSAGIQAIYPDAASIPQDRQYDLVLLHNVIHELPEQTLLDLLQVLSRSVASDGVINVLEQSVLPHGERGYFVFTPNSLAHVLAGIGFVSTVSTRTSRSGVPIYELTARRSDEPGSAPISLRSRLAEAVSSTLASNLTTYESQEAKKRWPLEYAFLAINMANGNLILRRISETKQLGGG